MNRWIIGVDEVGRGPIAGPVMVCAVAFNPKTRKRLSFVGLKDSKKMTPRARELWLTKANDWKERGIIRYAIAKRSAKFIDRHGISAAIRLCVSETLAKLAFSSMEIEIILDGSLYAPPEYKNQKTIIRGDAKHKEISLASVIAKVTRDALMEKLHKKHTGYEWFKNKGYGTAIHYLSLKHKGITPYHRRSFILDKN